MPPKPAAHVAVVGLGVGTLATYAEPGQLWTFYEIDPAAERIGMPGLTPHDLRHTAASLAIKAGAPAWRGS